ncbi:Ubiquinone biosynthesis protein COQ9 [Chlorella vulgaris]
MLALARALHVSWAPLERLPASILQRMAATTTAAATSSSAASGADSINGINGQADRSSSSFTPGPPGSTLSGSHSTGVADLHEPPMWQQQQHQQQEAHTPEQDDFVSRRQQLLAATLKHVPQLGWAGGAAAAAAASELGLSPAAAGMLGSDAQTVQHFVAICNRRLDRELAGMQQLLSAMEPRQRLRTALQLRLCMLEPVIQTWPQALALLAQPEAAPRSLQLAFDLADSIWHAAGDTSTDATWYSKRALLTGVYVGAELFMLNDASPGFADTWAALDRGLEGVVEAEGAVEGAGSFASSLGDAAAMALTQLSSMLRRPM